MRGYVIGYFGLFLCLLALIGLALPRLLRLPRRTYAVALLVLGFAIFIAGDSMRYRYRISPQGMARARQEASPEELEQQAATERAAAQRAGVRLFFVGGRISLYGSEAGGNWIRHGVVREQRRGPVADGTCAVSDGWGAWWRVSVRINAPAARGGLRTVATAAKCHRAPVDSHPVAGQMPTGLQ